MTDDEANKVLAKYERYMEMVESVYFDVVVMQYDADFLDEFDAWARFEITNEDFIPRLEDFFNRYGEVIVQEITVLEL